MGMPTVIVRYRGGPRRTYRAVLISYGLVSAPEADRHPEIVWRARKVLPNRFLRLVAYRVDAEGELWRVVEATARGRRLLLLGAEVAQVNDGGAGADRHVDSSNMKVGSSLLRASWRHPSRLCALACSHVG
jgi:hypothetical protein